MKKILTVLLVTVFILLLSACGNNENDGIESQEWKLGFNTVEESTRGVAAEKFKEIVEEETDGKITVELFPNEELGSDNEMVESVQVGALDFQLSSSGVLAEIMPEFSATDLPFIFEDEDEAHAILDGEYGELLQEVTEEEGIRMLNTFSIGFSQITTNKKPINAPEDLNGVSIRSPNEPVPIATFEQLGSQVTTVPFTEVYLGLQQGSIDGQFNPLTAIKDSNFQEVQNYLAMTDIIFYHAPFIMNQDLWEELDDETKEIVQNAADEASKEAREFESETNEKVLDEIEDEFDEITTPDKDAFLKELQPVYDKFESEIGEDVMDLINNSIEDYRNN